jgi:hypothetical protein
VSDVVYVVERGKHTKAELEAMPAIEVPKEILEDANFMNLYMEKVLQRDDVIDAEFEAPDEWPT